MSELTPFQEIKQLEGNLSGSYVYQIKCRCSNEAQYLKELRAAYKDHQEAIARIQAQRKLQQ